MSFSDAPAISPWLSIQTTLAVGASLKSIDVCFGGVLDFHQLYLLSLLIQISATSTPPKCTVSLRAGTGSSSAGRIRRAAAAGDFQEFRKCGIAEGGDGVIKTDSQAPSPEK